MDLTAFNSRLGISQGRIPLSDAEEYIFVLGDDLPGYFHHLAPGDFAQVVQETDLTDTALIRPELTLTVPDSTPAGVGFEVSVVVDGVKFAVTTCSTGRTRRITDLAPNVSKLTGMHTVGVRLEVVEG